MIFVDGVVEAHHPAVPRDELLAVAFRQDRGAVEEDPSELAHATCSCRVQPSAGRSNQTCTWLVPTEFS
jgi:hypothetical protein